MLDGAARPIKVSSANNLRMFFFLIGYRNLGESVVILFIDMATDKVVYSIVNDCYVNHHENITKQILEDYNVKPLSLLCWTHPDLDHSVGLAPIVEEHCTEESQIILPEYFHGVPEDIVTVNNQDEKNVVDQIFNLNNKNGHVLTHISVSDRSHEIDNVRFEGMVDNTILTVSVDALTPKSFRVSPMHREGKKYSLKNDISISTILNLDDYYFYLGGDATNQMINDTSSGYLRKCRFIKVPHHGSPTASDLIQYLGKNVDTACFTKKTKKLPDMEVVKDYKENAQCVGLTGDKDHIRENHGIILYEYDFSGEDIKVTVTPYDNAYLLKGDKYGQ